MNTSNLDSISEKGILFNNAYTTQPVCGPARSAIFTGTYPHTNGSIANSMSMNERTKTIGQRLTANGVHAAYIGKYHLDGGDYFGDGLCPEGWDKGPAMYEEITNIPFMVQWDGLYAKAVDNNKPVSHIDIVPTVLDYFNLELPRSLEGKSLLPLMTDNKAVNQEVFMEYSRYELDHDGFGGFQPIRAITDGRFKLTINLLTQDELYDTVKDPGEMNNLIRDESMLKKRNQLHDKLLDWMNDTRDPFRGYYWERRPWRNDARPATWDYTGMTRQRYCEPDEVGQLDYATGLRITDYIRVKE